MPTAHPLQHARRCSDRRIRRKAFKSVFKYAPVEPPFVYFLTTAQTAAAYGISEETLEADRKSWARCGTGSFAAPVLMDEGTFRYRWDDVTSARYGENFIDVMKRNHREFVAADQSRARTRSTGTSNN